MEKYSKWRDEQTGIHPFLPHRQSTLVEHGVTWHLKWKLIGPLWALLKAPWIAAAFAAMVLFTFVLNLIPIAAVNRPLSKITVGLFSRVILLLLGFWSIEERYVKLNHKSKNPPHAPGANVSAGDIIITNHTSYIDVLYFTFKYNPVFATVPTEWDANTKAVVLKQNWLAAFNDALFDAPHNIEQCFPLQQVIKEAEASGQPVVIFPEGTTGNGQGLLSCMPVLSGVNIAPSKINIVGLKFDFEDYSPSFPIGSAAGHIFWLAAQYGNKLEARFVAPDEITSPDDPKTQLFEGQQIDSSKSGLSYSDLLFNHLATILRIKRSRLTSKDKQEFRAYWFNYKANYATNAASPKKKIK